ncbi:MAG: DUF5777 family beta-barrel protein, partial [Bacteroidota bacterium]
MVIKYLLNYLFIGLVSFGFAQVDDAESVSINDSVPVEKENVESTFHSTRVINGHSIETLRKGVLEFRVEHRFGDLAGADGGAQSMFGLDNSSDIRIALEYGVSDKFMLGFGRSKGTGNPYRSLLDGFAKYRVLEQQVDGFPFSLAMIGSTFFTYMEASDDESQVAHFPKWEHRLAYSLQLNIARKFGDRFSLAFMPTMVHRNYVPLNDANTTLAMGGALRCGITATTALLVEYYHVFSDSDIRQNYKNSLGLAFEWITFGHNFTVHLTNSKGFGEVQFIPYTFEDWLKGQFRVGFC